MSAADVYALGFALLGAWGVFTARKSFKAGGRWARLRWHIVLADGLFAGSCILCAAGLALGWFRAWMLMPLGASFLWMIPLPCYFDWVDRIGWVHASRNIFFVAVAVVCFVVGFGLVPLATFGL
ncbi:MAG: hypothetical protein ACE5IP_12410 [Terriglobia bacterium]